MFIQTSAPVHIPPPPNALRRQLLTPLPEPGEFLLVLDNSSMEKFVTCPRSAEYYLVWGREAQARNAALTFGGALHAGLEALLKGEPDLSQDRAILEFFEAHPAPPDEYRTPVNALEVLKHYRQRSMFPDYEQTILTDAKGPLIERPFELPLGTLELDAWVKMPWLTETQLDQCKTEWDNEHGVVVYVSRVHLAWSGRMDAIVHTNGAARVMDHKTTSIAGDQVIQDFQLSNQTIGYVWAANKLWPELNVSGFCVNFIHLKRPTKGAGIADRGVRGGDPALNFFRSYFEYTPQRLAAWQTNVLHVLSDFLHCLTRNYFPTHTKWCFGKYGKCSYHDVCINDNESMQQAVLLSDMYKPVTWNPVR